MLFVPVVDTFKTLELLMKALNEGTLRKKIVLEAEMTRSVLEKLIMTYCQTEACAL
jgi:hypothetical protein